MLFKKHILDGIVSGEIDLAFRNWARPTVKAGTRLRTGVGVVEIDAIDSIDPEDITDDDIRRAGFASREALLASLSWRGASASGRATDDRSVYRIEVRFAGRDPRAVLREQADLTPDEVTAIGARLDRLDAASTHGPWTRATLQLIAERPATRAADLAASVGRPKAAFKADVRKLKELGLTESLDVGYRLSPRGRAILASSQS